jgi:hypothetical protein
MVKSSLRFCGLHEAGAGFPAFSRLGYAILTKIFSPIVGTNSGFDVGKIPNETDRWTFHAIARIAPEAHFPRKSHEMAGIIGVRGNCHRFQQTRPEAGGIPLGNRTSAPIDIDARAEY